MPEDMKRPRLKLLVADSGRTLCMRYHDIKRMRPDFYQLGDVVLARMGDDPDAVMALQITRPNGTAWRFEALELDETPVD